MNNTNHYYVEGNIRYCVSELVELSKELTPFDYPVEAFDLSRTPWDMYNLNDFIDNMKRVKECNDDPIILTPLGQIADGNHRMCKAIIEGKKSIKAIRLTELPMGHKID